ncbi:Cof-type HAD-IIB family hydrolase [Mycoplasmopsis lipofaciens]|uniref:Cof-type HAD-IIB family hydrolase n=1 Tax=Mycoplasmopsis lipofaciens TaxID=114884 RepID=UPI00068FBB4A|nr:Cof-type HAD-IIB family hydrolase [Mycoplasmopsis lipofaciens]
MKNKKILNFDVQIYFVDIDGTFLDQPNEKELISSKNINIARKINEKKILCLSTGRKNSEFVMNIAQKINSPYVICQNGAIIVNKNNEVLIKNPMNEKDVKNILEVLKKEDMFIMINGNKDVFYGRNSKISLMRDWVVNCPKKPYSKMQLEKEITKLLVFGKDIDKTNEFKLKLKKEFPNLEFHTVSSGYSLEITDKKANKGLGNKFICNLLNIDPKYAVHIGDSGNDTNCLPHIPNFIAMGNSTNEVKKKACYIAPNYTNGGVAKLLSELENISIIQ